MGLLPDLDVGHQAEQGSTPVGAPPGVGVVQAVVFGAGFAVGHSAAHIGPDGRGCHFAGLDAGDGFDVACQPFFQPVLIVGKGRQRGMDQFMGDDPING